MKLEGKSPRGKALAGLIVMLGKHPAMLDKKSPEAPKTPKSPKEEAAIHEHEMHVEAPSALSEEKSAEMPEENDPMAAHSMDSDDLDSIKHDHEDDECHEGCPVRVAVSKRMGR